MPGSASGLNLVEVFWSVQGEGTLLGEPCVFVRFGECDLRCAWCDSPHTWKRADSCRVETSPGSGHFVDVPNPVPVSAAVQSALGLAQRSGDIISLTGGEPLLQPEAARALAEALREQGARILLETHGLAVDALSQVLDYVDIVSMDWKLSSSVRRVSDPRGQPVASFHEQHEEFLRRAVDTARADVYVKVVLTTATQSAEIEEMCRRVARCAPETTVILQPVSPHGPVRDSPEADRLLEWVRLCRGRLADVRLIPQTHKMLGVR